MPTVVTDDNVTLSYIDQGSGPVIMLIAGFCAPATSWVLQQGDLVKAGYRVLSVDRRGHGDSDAPEHGATMARHGRDVQNFLAALDIDDAVLCGGSMGASTIWSYIEQFGTSRVKAVVSVDQTPKMVNTPDWPNGFYGLTEDNKDTFFADGVPDTGRGLPKRKSLVAAAKLVAKLGGLPKMASPDTPPMKALLHDHAIADWRPTVAGVEVPVLMVAGRDSQFWPFTHAADAVAQNPFGRSVVLEKCGHAANMDRPKEFNAAMLNFLDSLD
ncbi:alpha/beta fold hydrolase [Rhodococcoides kyotonense]|uniref:Pimeloyl-ACP methyl ester carboxylesterase n=1 Tax=Rhodococcoides kyotonense TaxID=398843 RepID=A0A239FHN3_9NOCA|nr:alpha/beta hydrolase [Rhodococcus kyotonensis]SNS56261.1 Pimeloyl-ACP methyl ester carboxylesterase [Rhodococcus kyotonensis]